MPSAPGVDTGEPPVRTGDLPARVRAALERFPATRPHGGGAFQLLGAHGDAGATGRPVGDDLREGTHRATARRHRGRHWRGTSCAW